MVKIKCDVKKRQLWGFFPLILISAWEHRILKILLPTPISNLWWNIRDVRKPKFQSGHSFISHFRMYDVSFLFGTLWLYSCDFGREIRHIWREGGKGFMSTINKATFSNNHWTGTGYYQTFAHLLFTSHQQNLTGKVEK